MEGHNYINIREVLSRLHRHPLLQDVTLEQVIQYTVDFISIFGLPKMYETKEVSLKVENYRVLLPEDFISIIQVSNSSGVALRSMTDNFLPKEDSSELTFKIQGRVIYTSFKEGELEITYQSIPIDNDGFPLLLDNPVFLKTLESYIKKEVFSILFDLSKLKGDVYQNSQQQYAWLAGQLRAELTMPTIQEMESIKNMWTSMIARTHEFNNGFKTLGRETIIKNH